MAGTNLGIAEVDISADIGGVGINRFFMDFGAGSLPTATELTGWSEAVMFLYNPIHAYVPSTVTFTFQPVVKVVDSESGALVAELPVTGVPAPILGTGTLPYAAGSGVRLYWHTSTVSGRRFIRGATYITPISPNGYTNSGGLDPTLVSSAETSGGSYITAATGAGGVPVIWHRPAKLTHVGGLVGPIVACTATQQPGSLRSRRS